MRSSPEPRSPSPRPPRAGAGVFQWSFGPWFGSVTGGTLWMGIGGLLLLPVDPWRALVPLACAGLGSAVGVALWRARTSVAPYPALQGLLALLSVLAAVVVFVFRGVEEPVSESPWVSVRAPWAVLAIFPGLMLLFHLREHSGRGHPEHEPPGRGPRLDG